MNTPAFIYDAVRTPRGKGKKDGSLHEVKPVDLFAGLLKGLEKKHDLDTSRVDDIIMGCVMPVGEQGTNMAKIAPMVAGWDETVCGMQLDRFCASALEAVGLAAVKVMAGWEDMVVAGGVESMSRVKISSLGGAWMDDPATSIKTGFLPRESLPTSLPPWRVFPARMWMTLPWGHKKKHRLPGKRGVLINPSSR